MNTTGTNSSCCCGTGESKASTPLRKIRRTSKSLPSVLMSVLIAFFPKCPMCWAVYMSMFGSLGLARLPYLPWLLPVLIALLAIHLLMLLRKAPQKGYLPFLMSLGGALVILTGRAFFPAEKWLLITGMLLIISGSLCNSFSATLPLNLFKKTI